MSLAGPSVASMTASVEAEPQFEEPETRAMVWMFGQRS